MRARDAFAQQRVKLESKVESQPNAPKKLTEGVKSYSLSYALVGLTRLDVTPLSPILIT